MRLIDLELRVDRWIVLIIGDDRWQLMIRKEGDLAPVITGARIVHRPLPHIATARALITGLSNAMAQSAPYGYLPAGIVSTTALVTVLRRELGP